MPQEPVQPIPTDEPGSGPQPGIGLCLSGGGYRAMIFHVGVLWRLYHAGVLRSVSRISSVSGGSITAGFLALKWKHLSFDPARLDADFVHLVVEPLRTLASETIDADAIISGLGLPGSVGDRVVAAYHLADALRCPFDRTTELAETPTRLKRMDDTLQERLINRRFERREGWTSISRSRSTC